MFRPFVALFLLTVALRCSPLYADGPGDNIAANVRRIPKLGIELSDADRTELQQSLEAFAAELKPLQANKNPRIVALLPDVLIYQKAVRDALQYQEFFDAKEIPIAKELLAEGRERAAALAKGESPWLLKTGPIVRGYISRIDGSVQPYGLVVPTTHRPGSPHKHRLDFWYHGRGETLSELNFLQDRRKNAGQFTPSDALVLHPYGRYCNANKFAGEIDAWEALESAKTQYAIDEDRIAARGFSMGGAACWQFAAHYGDRFFAAAPGAGFSETPDFLKVFQKEDVNSAPWYERKLYRWYDCNLWAENFSTLPTVAYSGDKDVQKQAADVMERAFKEKGLDLVHIIGRETGHSYHAEAKQEIDRRMDALARAGRDRTPRRIRFVTYTLRYNRLHWVKIDALARHWEKAEIEAEYHPGRSEVTITTNENVKRFTLELGSGDCPFDASKPVTVTIDGFKLETPRPRTDRSWKVSFHRSAGTQWSLGEHPEGLKLMEIGRYKAHGLQGPIDDAFLDAFLFVRPTGKSDHPTINAWVDSEMNRAIEHWRRHFRGEPRVKNDVEVTGEDLAKMHIVLWGDATSNSLIGKIAPHLPIKWNSDGILIEGQTYPVDKCVLVSIQPNPLNEARYVVLNSSFTFRDYAYLNNARQTAKLPDWAVIDITVPPNAISPGRVVDADFFDENWRYQRSPERAK